MPPPPIQAWLLSEADLYLCSDFCSEDSPPGVVPFSPASSLLVLPLVLIVSKD